LYAPGLLAGNIILLGLVGIVVSRGIAKAEAVPFIMELPLYHRPDPQTIGFAIWVRTIAFVKKAGTVILAVSVIVWLLSYLPEGRVDDSLLASLGRLLAPIGAPMGLDWKMVTALLTSIVAKENVLATLGVLYGVGEKGLVAVLPTVMSRSSALALLTVLMLFIPCAATFAVMRREMAERRWFIASLLTMLGLSGVMGAVVYHVALWLGF
ncbi:MAG: nucleoside recognition domain-containing protein, partial [Smithellaceae bacterium]|nr:nucleoside recognition domain-containing protein [Smithellaceae bacterium]